MRNVLLFLTIFFMMGSSSEAQSLAEAMKLWHYERYDGAEELLHRLLQADPNNTGAWWLLTQVYVHKHRIPALDDSLRSMPAGVRQQPMALCAFGQLAPEKSKKARAAFFFSQPVPATKEKDPLILLAIPRAHQTADSGNAQYAIGLLD